MFLFHKTNIYILIHKNTYYMGFEEALSNSMVKTAKEKTFVDKILSKEEVVQIKELIKKDKLTRKDLLELLYLISANESKLVNYSVWDRYVVLKFYCWLREFIKITELLLDYQDRLVNNQDFTLSPKTKKQLDNIQRLFEHNAKFLIDLYLNIARTSLSVNAVAFKEISQNKFELNYPHISNLYPQPPEKKGMMNRLFGGG